MYITNISSLSRNIIDAVDMCSPRIAFVASPTNNLPLSFPGIKFCNNTRKERNLAAWYTSKIPGRHTGHKMSLNRVRTSSILPSVREDSRRTRKYVDELTTSNTRYIVFSCVSEDDRNVQQKHNLVKHLLYWFLRYEATARPPVCNRAIFTSSQRCRTVLIAQVLTA
jgi:hypothetical protein